MTHPIVLSNLAPAAALVIELAAEDIETLGWCRPMGADICLGLVDHSEPWEGVDDHIPPETLTLVGALHRATGAEVVSWVCLTRAEWRPLWDALVLALAAHTGIWGRPRTGLHAVESVTRWERTVATHQDVLAVMRRAVAYARDSATTIDCPSCGCDPRPGETPRGDACPVCDGLGVVQLHPGRWLLRAVRLTGGAQ